MATTKAQQKATMKYIKNNLETTVIRLNKVNDADIIKRLKEVGNKQGYIKELIRKDIESNM